MKKSLALILGMFLLLSMFEACSNGATPSAQPSAAPSAAASAVPSAAPTGPEAIVLPLSNEKLTYTIWNGPMNPAGGQLSPNDSTAYQEAEKRTNIHIEWNQPAQGMGAEQFNLIIASQNYPDVFFSGTENYVGGFDKFISDGVIRDLSELVAKYAPNFTALRNSDETVRRYTMTDSGNIPYFRTISPQREPTWLGGWARQDWLDKAGTGIVANNVETYDQFHDMLAALKESSGVAPYYLWSNKTGNEEYLMTGFGVLGGYLNRGGKAVFGPTDAGYLEYLTLMNQWYTEGLIDPEFYARAGLFAGDMAMLIKGDFGAFDFLYMSTMIEMQAPAESGMNLQGVTAPVKNKGDIRKLAYYGVPQTVMGGATATITNNSDDVVPLVKWLDYFYSEEGSILSDYGVEGEGYTLNTEGKPAVTELIYANPDSLSSGDAQFKYTIGPMHPHLYHWERGFMPNFPEKALKVGTDIWDRNYQESETMPEVAISTEESAEYAAVMSDIKTYVQENTVKFIIGSRPLSEFQAYVDWINTHGLDRCNEIQQKALDRYNKR